MPLNSISPIDGRYEKYTKPLVPYFSESASMKYKILMECEYLIALSETKGVRLRKLSAKEKSLIRNVYEKFSLIDAQIITDIELKGYKNIKATNHDFKAIEYFTKDKLKTTSLKNCLEWVHFALTSEDASNIAYALMLSEGLRDVFLPALEEVIKKIGQLAKTNKNMPILARTHGQPASPTTFGKEFKIFYSRLNRQLGQLKKYRPQAKLNGATGNYNALAVAYPRIDWVKFSEKFIRQINKQRKNNLEASLLTTQIESSDSYAELFDIIRRVNTILIDFNQDVWRYISDDWIGQKLKEGEVGSSTMPHKVNPWFLENSEGNLGIANSLFEFFSRKLPVSRLQRDLSNSTVLRNIGTAFGHSLIGYKYLINQLGRLQINKQKTLEDLKKHPEIIAEAIQTILRREGVKMPYEKLKELTRGKQVTLDDIHNFINSLDINKKIKKELLKITPENYIGLASKLASM
ncbi:adenylosuccinate lyase [Candidatus Nomurabacteria bacterium RIFCSPLOWO2_01_FULL_39_18]|uniref:Adenylosuccinate lyase n=1 Tax=Candidatus Nomurabacteria bacterium RIFCSPHIGHO2_01_FULL_40_24b TaxID=1801739 RepID=A0A1F6V6K7_9BACT|nr:MAG: adenylosuccinate lyase [Candidatus Nomurabacteria bacterium RIFCSPHIGHO2_01_FULL_40_24b]OGI89236.1 MAG: adenylosuccinate lyase [Candidatus Nomurabacteria bacterium RIFCSPLOWO2_01_FULL_39_18]